MYENATNANALAPDPEILRGKLEKAIDNLKSAYESVCVIDSKLFRPAPVDSVNKPTDDDTSLETLIGKVNLLASVLHDDLCRIREKI